MNIVYAVNIAHRGVVASLQSDQGIVVLHQSQSLLSRQAISLGRLSLIKIYHDS
jgi:hypothetical protein